MKPEEFCYLARWLLENKPTPAGLRSCVSRGYYAALHTSLQILFEMGAHIPSGENKHEKAPDLLKNAQERDVVVAGVMLDNLRLVRNRSDYALDDRDVESAAVSEVRLREAESIIATLSTLRFTKGKTGGPFETAKANVVKRANLLFRGLRT